VCIALCTIVAHNIAQNRPDSFPPYPPDNHHISDDVYLRETAKFDCPTYSSSEVVMRTNKRSDKQTDTAENIHLASLRYAGGSCSYWRHTIKEEEAMYLTV